MAMVQWQVLEWFRGMMYGTDVYSAICPPNAMRMVQCLAV
jgi:hypothetical protein